MADLILIFGIFLIAVVGAVFLIQKTKIDQIQSEAIRDLERRLTDLMINQLKEIRGSVDGTSQAMHNQISSFTKETSNPGRIETGSRNNEGYFFFSGDF